MEPETLESLISTVEAAGYRWFLTKPDRCANGCVSDDAYTAVVWNSRAEFEANEPVEFSSTPYLALKTAFDLAEATDGI
jgi:hypothetical protein